MGLIRRGIQTREDSRLPSRSGSSEPSMASTRSAGPPATAVSAPNRSPVLAVGVPLAEILAITSTRWPGLMRLLAITASFAERSTCCGNSSLRRLTASGGPPWGERTNTNNVPCLGALAASVGFSVTCKWMLVAGSGFWRAISASMALICLSRAATTWGGGPRSRSWAKRARANSRLPALSSDTPV
jgi:hypothetical protein